ncbi:prephenate dehydratase [Jannaschia sp. LMIT008]|uniref:prephenate dehydratase n=1 Tax=Jannaschia maritima TaxID=3032585 RepID=UPI0028117B67|nr:prephenate dehydratase [Jannaschia sp. LMIT008]
MAPRIAFQGDLGSYSHQACAAALPDHDPLPCTTFEDALAAVRDRRADRGMIAIENSTYGRVADVHRLLPDSGLHIVGEAFVRVRIALMANEGSRLEDIRRVRAHLVLIPQARAFLDAHGIAAEAAADSAGAAAALAAAPQRGQGVLASSLAARIHGLDVLAEGIEDMAHNTTRFIVMAREPRAPAPGSGPVKTTFVFRVRNIPAALYKAMGGFATNGVNMTKLESYMVDGRFSATQFYADIEGHPDDPPVARALEELGYFTDRLAVLGVYPADPEHFDGGHD